MNLDFFDRRSAERFAQLLDETHGGRRHHARGPADEQLAELVAIGHTLSAVRPSAQVDPDFRSGLRAMLVATAVRDGIGETASESAPGVHAAVREPRRRTTLGKGAARRIRARGAIVIGVAAGALAVSGISAASENAVPGDALYGVKLSTERAQLAMAGNDDTRGALKLDFARTRLAEAAALPGDSPDFAGLLDHMDGDTVQGVRLLAGSAVTGKDAAPLGLIDTFVVGQRRVLSPALDRLSPANRERALTSLSLLDDIGTRSAALRSGLACDPPTVEGRDQLGPKPGECMAGSNRSQPSGEERGHSGTGTSSDTGTGRTPSKVTPTKGGTTAGQTGADDTVPPGTGAGQAPANAPTTEPADRKPNPPADDADDDDGGLLGGVLGGIFGGGD